MLLLPFFLVSTKEAARFTTVPLKPGQFFQISREHRIALHAIAQTFQIVFQRGLKPFWERIDDPILFSRGPHHSPAPQVSKMFGNFHLRLIEDFLKMADAERRFVQQMQNTQPRPIAEALINLG